MEKIEESRILWITERYPPLGGGMAVSAARQVEGLRRRGFPVDVAAFTLTDPRVVMSSVPRDGGTDHHLSRKPRRGLTAQRCWRLVSQEHSRRPYAFVVGFGAGMPGYLAVTYAAWLGCSSLVQVRGNDFDQDWFEPQRGQWVREALARATVVGAVAPEMVRRIEALFPGKTVVFVPNGVDVARLELLPGDRDLRARIRRDLVSNGERVLGLFGELKHKKGIPFWMSALRDTGLMDRVRLLVVGNWVDEETGQILGDPQLAPPSLNLPFTARDRMPGLYGACDYIVLPSLFDGMPNVLLEAMAMGVAPIVSNAGAMGEIVRDGVTGFVFETENRRDAARATARALSQSAAERNAMGRRASAFVTERFSIERETEALVDILLGET